MKTKLEDIARYAGVSKSTASRALAGSTLVREETRQRILEIAEQYSYKPNALAQAVATKRSGILGLCLYIKTKPYFGHTFYGPLLDGAIEEAKEHGYHIVLAPSNQVNTSFDEHFIQDSIDGVILVSFMPQRAMAEFKRRRIPLVLVNDALPSDNTAYIVQNNYAAARQIMQHLVVEKGYKNIAFMNDRLSHSSYYMRYLAYLDVLREHGLAPYENSAFKNDDLWGNFARPSDDMLHMFGLNAQPVQGTPIVTHNNTSATAMQRTQFLLQTGQLPRAIFAASDSIAIGVIKALQNAGLRIPEDIAVAGYDNIESSQWTSPALTTVAVDPHEMGRLAVKELLAQIANPELESRMRMVNHALLIRQST